MIICVRTGIWFISYLSYWKKHLVILSVEIVWQNHSTLIVFKSKLNLRAQNDTLKRIKYKTNFLLIYSLYILIYFFFVQLYTQDQEKLRRKNEDSFHKESIGQILNELNLHCANITNACKLLQLIHFILCTDKSSISLKKG